MEARKAHRRCVWRGVALVLGLVAVLPSIACQAAEEEAPFPTTAGADPVVVPTFTCLGLYWAPANGGDDRECAVRYHAVGAHEWREALPLWFDARNREYRGSIVNLEPGTVYEIALKLEGTTRTVCARTWSERFPVAGTVRLPEHSRETLVIDQSGTPDGYVLYTAAEGKRATIDVEGRADECVAIRASYVILRGVALKGGGTNGITIEDGSHDVIIERCDISGWGRVAPDGQGRDYDAGVAAEGSGVRRVVLQRSKIHHPRADTNSWKEPRTTERGSTNHPMGPQGVSFFGTGGNHVIRYNEVYSDEEHRFNDCLGGGENFSYAGFPDRDSDIYGNRLSECWDDAIESEGANANVRIWGNFITNTFVKIAIASVSIGPIYIWRNVAGTSRYSPFGTTDEDEHGPFLKAGSRNRYNGGRIFVFHNTLLQPPPPAGLQKTLGCNIGLSSYGGDVLNMTSRNNVLHIVSERSASIGSRTTSPTNDFDYDLYNGRIDGPENQETHGIQGAPIYNAGTAAGCFWLAPDSPGRDAGVRLPNFNDGFTGKAPDMGACETGTRPMEFGVDAYVAR
jgi:hypothetical protein